MNMAHADRLACSAVLTVLVATLKTMGHSVPDTSALHWRTLLAGMKEELGNRSMPVDYVHIFERIVQLVRPIVSS